MVCLYKVLLKLISCIQIVFNMFDIVTFQKAHKSVFDIPLLWISGGKKH